MTVTGPASPLPTRRPSVFDPPEEFRELRDKRPVSRLAFPGGGEGWLVTRADVVRRVLIDPRFSSRRQNISPVREIPKDMRVSLPGLFIQMDPPEHTRYRRAITAQFTVKRMRDLRSRIGEIVADHLDRMAAGPEPADLVAAFARPIPLLVICEMLGVPEGTRAVFVRNTAVVGNRESSPEELRAAVEGNREGMRAVIRDKRDHPDGGFISALVHEDEARFTEEELISIGLLLLVNGNETTANMLAFGTYALLEHPDQRAVLRAEPQRWEAAVEELLRYLSVIQFGIVRVAAADVDLEGERIREGDPVVLGLPAANRDPAFYRDPDRLDVTREELSHLAFGHGVHQCVGQHLARAELLIGLRALFERFEGLRLAVPASEVRPRGDMSIYGVHELPVRWTR